MVQYSSSTVSLLAISPLVPFLMSRLHLDCAFRRKVDYTARGRLSEVSILVIGVNTCYFTEPEALIVQDGNFIQIFMVKVGIAEPNKDNENLTSIRGQDVLYHWKMEHEPAQRHREFIVKNIMLRIKGDLATISSFSQAPLGRRLFKNIECNLGEVCIILGSGVITQPRCQVVQRQDACM